ncbi:MAG TPA: hypothetical protein PLA90_17515, partial [Candidatus Sumerlaeota bacterium]|nr:hypothetical protein [Candidatus Sumerlaeota bacterium]
LGNPQSRMKNFKMVGCTPRILPVAVLVESSGASGYKGSGLRGELHTGSEDEEMTVWRAIW